MHFFTFGWIKSHIMSNGKIVDVYATTLSKLGEFLGIISRALVSSTYLMRSRQSDQFVRHHRKEDHTQFSSLGNSSF